MMFGVDETGILLNDVGNNCSGSCSIDLKFDIGKCNTDEKVFFTSIFAYTLSRFVGNDKVLFNVIDGNSSTMPLLVDCKNQNINSFLANTLESIKYSEKNPIGATSNIIFNYQKNEINLLDFNANIIKKGNDFLLKINYSKNYSKNTIERFLNSFKLITHDFLKVNELKDVTYTTLADLNLLDSYNQTEHPLKYGDVLDAFNDNLASNPENMLVSFEDRSYSYGESAFIADKIAKRLIDLCVKSQDHVAFLTERSELYLFNILSILSIGAVYVPLENKLPNERIELILEDTSSKVLIVSDETYGRAKSLSTNALILNISSILKDEIKSKSSLDVSYGNVACVLYTSGTTGLPKGVNITRKSIVNVCEWYADKYGFGNNDIYGLYASIGFDVANYNISLVMYAGARLSIVPSKYKLDMLKLNDYFIEQGVNHTWITTQVGKLFMQSIESTSLDFLMVGGEKLGTIENPKDFTLIDVCGPTEAFEHISSIKYVDKIDVSSIGHLNYNTKLYVLDDEYRRVPIGAVGELYLSGYQIADGYLNRDDKTAEAFLTNPFDDDEDYSVLYRTGDMVRILPDGSIGIVGRRDSQVKIRGNRVELSEVESTIREINYIEDVTVQTIKNGNNNELVAYVVPTIEMDNIDEVIRKYVSISKPDYMIPSYIIVLDNIPLNINGKVDRMSLPKVDLSSLHADYVAPTNNKEKIIVNAFEEVFNQEKISIYDDFIRMGGDSISAIRVIALLQKNGISCSARDILSYQTPFLIAQNVHDVNQVSYSHVEGEVDLLPIQSYFFDKIDANEYSQEYILKSKMKLDADILQKAFDEVSKTHDMLRATFKHEDDHIIQEILPVNTCVCEINEIDVDDVEDFNKTIGRILLESNKNLDINDSLIKINLVHYGDTSYLLFIIHHLIIDGISWSILIDDLTYFYTLFLENKEGELAVPYPYKSWVRDVEQLVSNISESEKQHWIEVNNRLDDSLIEGKSIVFAFNVETSFSADNLLMLSEEEYLALSIARAYKKTYNEDIIFNKESYGRDESIANVNRTIGWFTSQFPVPVSVNAGYDNVSLIQDIYSLKVAFKDVKNLGINYGSLVYGTHELEFKHCPVTLNFLSGEFVFRNELFASLDEYLSSDKKIDLRIFESVTYGISIKISRVENDYVVTGSYAEGTYIGDKYEDFIDNIKHELEFISNYKFEDDNVVSFLSEAQLGIYLDEKVRSLGTAYSTKGTFKFKPNTTLDEIKKVIQCLVDKHPILKGRIVDGDVPLLVCDSYPVIEITETDDYSSLIKPFNLDEYLARFYIDDDGKSIFYDIHHMICDGTSHHIINKELNDIVEGNFNESIDFGFVYDGNNNFESRFKNIYEEAQEFYRKNLSSIDEVNTVLFDAEGSNNRIRLPIHGIKNSVKAFCHENGITVGNLLNAVFAYTYSRFTGGDKVFYTYTQHGRHEPYAQKAIGMFARTVPIIVDCSNSSIEDYLANVSDLILNSMKYSIYPYRLLANEFDLTLNGTFEYNYDLNDVSDVGNDIIIEDMEIDLISDFLCVVNDLDDGYLVRVDSCDKYSNELIIRFVNAFKEILIQIITKNELKEIVYTSNEDLKILDAVNQTEYSLDYDDILDAFNDNLTNYPNNNLVSYNDSVYSYAEGAFIADKIAGTLKDLGVRPQDNIAFLTERSDLYMFSVLSILSCGATYVPLDDNLPDDRVKFILEDTQSKVVIVSDETYGRVDSLVDDTIILNISDIVDDDIGTLSSLNVQYCDLACILYTSGTTGLPKGVKIVRKAIINLSSFYVKKYGLTNEDVFGLFSSIGFDAAFKAIFAVVYAGACLDVIPNEVKLDMDALNNHFISQGINHVDITTQVAKLLINQVEDVSLDVLFTGGEKLGEFDERTSCRFVDGYGPTEAYVEVATVDVTDRIDSSSVGHLIDNIKAYILDDEFRRVPIGAVGELYLSGTQIAEGYLNRQEETENAFLNNPFDKNEEYSTLYRTGDMVRLLPDNSLGVVGRRDGQVKIRGNRVELSEVESVIRELDYIEDVTVQTIKYRGNYEIVAYVVSSKEIDDMEEYICDHVGESKPNYMIPSFVISIDEIPLSVNGKVDSHSLPEVNLASLRTEYVAPGTDNERKIVKSFESVFNQNEIGIYDDFVRLGGDSITAIRIVSLLKKEGIECSARDILTYKIPYLISQNIAEAKKIIYDPVEGEIDLHPIQRFFFEEIDSNNYSQEFVLKSEIDIKLDILQKAFDELSDIHDMLRATYIRDDDNIIQKILPVGTSVCEIEEVFIEDDFDNNMGNIIFESNKSLDINGGLIKITLVRHADECYIVFVIHHLIIDGVSWSILIDDLTNIYKLIEENGEIDILRPYPFKLWVDNLKKLVSDISPVEKQHWFEVDKMWDDSKIKGKSKVFAFNVRCCYDTENQLRLTEEEYFALGIARAYKKTYGMDIIFNRESYGRDETVADVSRTIGWFTSQFPVPVKINCKCDDISLINDVFSIKKAFKNIKHLGLNYASLVYMTNDLKYKHCPVTFNFLSTEFLFKNEIFQSLDGFLATGEEIKLDNFDGISYGITFNVSRLNDNYLINGDYAEGTYLEEKFDEFVKNVECELEFLGRYQIDDIACPLSESQLGIYLDEKVKDMGTAYSVSGIFKCTSNKSIKKIEEAIHALIKKHPIFKGRIVDGETPLLVCDSYPSIEVVNTDDYSTLIKPFDLDKLLTRFFIIKNDMGKFIFYDSHHVISDGVTCALISQEFKDIFDGNFDDSLDVGFAIDSFNSFESKFKPTYNQAYDFYKNTLSDVNEVNALLFDGGGSNNVIKLPIRGIKNKIEEFSYENGITVGNLLNAVFAYTYSRFTGENKVYYASSNHGRHTRDLQNALGMFVRTIPVIVDCNNTSVKEYVRNVSDLMMDLMKHADYPYRLLANELDLNINVVFEYNFGLDATADDVDDLTIEKMTIDLISDFVCVVNDMDDGYLIRIESCDGYSDEFIIRFLNVFKEVLIQISDKRCLSDIDYVSSEDIKLLDSYNQTKHDLNYGDVLDAFNDNLAQYPSSDLVKYMDKSYTYTEGAFIADKIAKNLKDLGIGKQDNVAFLVERSELYLLNVLAVMSIGAVYIPLDEALPDERLNFMISDTDSSVVIVSDETYERAKNLTDSVFLNISDIINGKIGKLTTLDVDHGNIACILYTSGTTGIPKGVKITRKAIVNLATVYQDKYGIASDDVYGLFSTIGFDAALLAMMTVLFSGACLSIVPDNVRLDINALNNYFIQQNITHTLITSQVGRLFIQTIENTSLDVLLVGGEKLGEIESPENYLLVDAFGPTEACVFISSIKNSDKIDHSSIGPLGYNTKAYILDEEGRRVPIGATGELYLSGYQIADGYLNRDDENASVFITNPFNDDEDYNIMYRSGDMVKLLSDGTLAIVGRRDSQVKIRGNRVELSEVESIIRQINFVEDVTVQTIKNGTNSELVAYLVTSGEIENLKDSVCEYVARHKPEYMVPSFVIDLDEIPLNINGKVDKRALPDVDWDTLYAEYVAPTTETEKLIVEAFEKVFNHDIGVLDDFVRLGGDSLTAIKLLSYIGNNNISAADILTLKTPKDIAESIKESNFDLDIYSLESGCPLNEPQLNVYLDIIANDKVDSYLVPFSNVIPKGYDVYDVHDAVNALLDIHPILKMCISDDYDVPYLIESNKPQILVKDNFDKDFILQFLTEPFDLYDNLSRFLIVKKEDKIVLFTVLHHLISDALSLYSFKNNLKRVLNGEYIETDDSFLKVSAFNQQIKQTKEYDNAKIFYNTMFMDMDEVIVLSDDVVNETPGICSKELNVDISEFLAKHNIGDNVLFTSVFAYTLSRFVGGDKVLFNIVENGRSRFNNYDSIGMFANTLPIIADCKNQNVGSFIEYMSDLIYTVMKYNYYPFRFLANEYDVNSNILFQYFPSWIDLSEDTDYIDEIYDDIVGEMGDVISDLIVQVVQEKDKYNISISYSDKYSPYLVQQLIDSYELILNDIIKVEKLSDINYTSASDLELLDSYNQTEHSLKYGGIIEAFINQLSNVPDNIFTISDEISYTYAESAYLVNQINALLKENNLNKDDRVAIFVDRNHWVILSALGCLSQAITYIQIDEKYPDQRIVFMIDQSSSNTIITTDTFQSRVNSLIEEFKLDLNVINISHLSDNVKTSSHVGYVDESINKVACIIYTSGTTGTPKAVQMTRWQLVNFMQFYADDANFTNESVQGIFVSVGFDISLEMFAPIFTGGALTFVPYDIRLNINKLNEYYIKHNVTHTFITTQFAKLFIKYVSKTSLKYLRTGGEKLGHVEPPENYIMTDLYGPSEYNALSTMDIDKKIYESSVGILNWNTKVYILDNEKRRVPFGATGEIYVSGYQTTIGYLDNPEANENVLLFNPFDGEINGYNVMYKTGDIARFLPDGSMGIVGRLDSQVKIRGNRVELSEVEVTIRSLEYIKDVTIQTKIHDGNNELVAYVSVTDDFKGDIVKYVQGYLYENKPDYMVPSFVIELDRIPLTVNGKVDKKALPDVDFDSLNVEYVAPTTDDEKAIVEAFEEVFNQEKIGIHDDFIKLGGDSLIAIKLMSILNKKSINVDVKNILSFRTPQNIAQNINQKEYGFVLAKKGNINQNMFLLPPIGGLSPIFSKLIDKIDFEGNIYTIDDIKYSLPLSQLKKIENGNCTLDYYYKAIDKVFNDGDILAGYSLGCVFASLLAEKLENDNRTVDKCILIDSDLLFERDYEITTDEVINEFVCDVEDYPDDFIDKFVEVVRINSKLNYKTPNVNVHILFLSTWDSLKDRIAAISSNYDYIIIDSTHKRIIDEDIDKIIKYLGL